MEDDDSQLNPVNNVTFKRMAFDKLTVEGYSRAAVQTYWRIPELRLGFDLGAHPWEHIGTPTWMISHTHLDHIAALPAYVARRRLMKMSPPTIYLPETAVDKTQRVLDAFAQLDRGRLPCALVGVKSGDEIELTREYVVSVHRTYHTITSVGYIVWDRRRKLKPEFLGLAGNEIRDLRLAGQEVTNEVRTPLIAYLGDSTPKGLDQNPDMYRAKILIAEMTFVAPDHRREKIHKNGHMHLDDFVERKDRFENEAIIASHLSTRYTADRAERMIARRLPDWLDGRLHLWG